MALSVDFTSDKRHGATSKGQTVLLEVDPIDEGVRACVCV